MRKLYVDFIVISTRDLKKIRLKIIKCLRDSSYDFVYFSICNHHRNIIKRHVGRLIEFSRKRRMRTVKKLLTKPEDEDERERCQRREHETAIHVVGRPIRERPMPGELSLPFCIHPRRRCRHQVPWKISRKIRGQVGQASRRIMVKGEKGLPLPFHCGDKGGQCIHLFGSRLRIGINIREGAKSDK